MQQAFNQIAEKDGASIRPARVSLPEQRRVANSAAQVSHRAKLRALAEAMGGPCIVRDADGNGFLLTAEALSFIAIQDASPVSPMRAKSVHSPFHAGDIS